MSEYGDPDLETIAPLAPVPEATPAAPPAPRRTLAGGVAAVATGLVVLSLVVGFGTASLVLNARDKGSSTSATSPAPPTTVPAPTDPDAAVLGGLILNQSDVVPPNMVQLIDHGADLTSATLDLCNGTFASESQRTARRQVALSNAQQSLFLMSTEAILYRHAAVGAQAFGELRSVASHCPSTPVKSPVGEGTATTTFRTAPDRTWARTPTVDRLAYDFVSVSAANGSPSHSIAVYLRRGRVLMGLYFRQPDAPQAAVDGRTTVAGIVSVFEARVARVASRVANG
ncbi:MAG TPA: hypothetical protein VGP92_07080 [Acidimicrobiia bacterium]|nr:hypothetical protein [Acidimicrobiia bacterium]